MRILTIHNKYQQPGGEDYVFQAENRLLTDHGHTVDSILFDNNTIQSFFDKLLSGVNVIYNYESALRVEAKILSFRPDVIHVHNFVPIASPSIFFPAKKFNIPVIATLHNFRLICPSATLFFNSKIYEKSIRSAFPVHAILNGVYRNSKVQTAAIATMTRLHNIMGTWKNKITKFIVLTQFAHDKFRHSALRASDDQFILKPNFVTDVGKGHGPRENFFLFIGRLNEEKGIETLLKAAAKQNFELTMLGDGPLKSMVGEYAKKYPNISYQGYQDKASIIQYMKKCRALIFPSVWYEGFPITVLEAFCTGTPVIASRIGSLAEIIQDNINGLHFETGNEADLVDKVKILLNEAGFSEYLGNNARNTYLRHYTPNRNYEMLMDIYRLAIQDANSVEEKVNNKMNIHSLNYE